MCSTSYLSAPIASHVSSPEPWNREAPCFIRNSSFGVGVTKEESIANRLK